MIIRLAVEDVRYSTDGARAIRHNGRSWDCYFVNRDGTLNYAGLSCALSVAEQWLAGEVQ